MGYITSARIRKDGPNHTGLQSMQEVVVVAATVVVE